FRAPVSGLLRARGAVDADDLSVARRPRRGREPRHADERRDQRRHDAGRSQQAIGMGDRARRRDAPHESADDAKAAGSQGRRLTEGITLMAPFDAASPTTWLSAGRTPLLAVTSEPPWTLHSGGHLRTFHLLRALASRFDVRLVTPARGTDAESAASALAGEAVRPRIVRAARRSAAAEAVRVAVAAARREPYVM